ncbi:protein-L-isoaspartate O-methyltransferase [Lentilitoribacter sp. Alg239-R112]|uniref:protein-L-isoaspartate O-methyltransferase family protein n=1 Tax=Lentilitoribacter sp. Alg239-R112 TaxID=2305987 RepID=UPI00157511CA|nr:protein-L-isoaspartate O-methyltransferase [Lentilitoribacter sp. Alg239-R112]
MDFAAIRQQMVDNQVRTTDVTEHRLLDALLSVPREDFVPEDKKVLAYIDADIELSTEGRYVLEPSPLAKLIQAAEVRASEKVLEVGAGSGYVSAVLSHLADEVIALEVDSDLVMQAKDNLTAGGYNNVSVVSGDLAAGHKSNAPYDLIFVNGALGVEPVQLFTQMAEGGRMITVIGSGGAAQALLYVKENNQISSRKLFNISIPALPGFEKAAEFVF